MAASDAQIAANRANALLSTGPNTVAGKEASRRNALKHGLSGAGVVLPGEDEHEVAIRVAALEGQLVGEGDVLGTLLIRQVAIATIRAERAYRHETALAAERMRKAADLFDDERLVLAREIIADLAADPVTTRRRLLKAPEGVDALVERLGALREQTVPRGMIAWDDEEGRELVRCLGQVPGQAPLSRAALLTRGIVYDHWLGLDPAEFADLSAADRLYWALDEIARIIDDELAALAAHRATIDPTRAEAGRAEASERTLLDLGAQGVAIRRYAGAAERTILKMLGELRIMRHEAQLKAMPPAGAAEAFQTMVAEVPARKEVRAESASFRPPGRPHPRPRRRATLESIVADPKPSFVPFAVGRVPGRPIPPPS